jgi:hypothetical protein
VHIAFLQYLPEYFSIADEDQDEQPATEASDSPIQSQPTNSECPELGGMVRNSSALATGQEADRAKPILRPNDRKQADARIHFDGLEHLNNTPARHDCLGYEATIVSDATVDQAKHKFSNVQFMTHARPPDASHARPPDGNTDAALRPDATVPITPSDDSVVIAERLRTLGHSELEIRMFLAAAKEYHDGISHPATSLSSSSSQQKAHRKGKANRTRFHPPIPASR